MSVDTALLDSILNRYVGDATASSDTLQAAGLVVKTKDGMQPPRNVLNSCLI